MVLSVDMDYPNLSDHFAVMCLANLARPSSASHRWVTTRKLKDVDKGDIRTSTLLTSPEEALDGLIAQYNGTMGTLMEKHAPLKKKRVSLRPQAPWYSDDIREAKQLRHQLERQWRRTRLHIHREILRAQSNVVNSLIRTTKCRYFADRIAHCGKDQKRLFQIVHGLLRTRGEPILPKHTSDQQLADGFNDFFVNKIVNIRNSFSVVAGPERSSPNPPCTLDHFALTTEEELGKILANMPSKSCPPADDNSNRQ